MSPAKFHDLQLPKREINGPRPSPLKLHKDSHPIHKPASSSNSASSSSFMSSLAPVALAKKQQPVIIYTHSPKIIHTKARDFMALVQKLTGLSRARDETAPPQPQEKDQDPSLQNSLRLPDYASNVGGSMSPSVFEFIKELPEY
ncbi:VQ domain-containing protein [Cephalotus follicularis]|uniref:VQ domain-containing protein n=1 Tax=Cephalotus follicularis TaxID=3775 RepID=A0A1Q3BEH5_CEPFO|nr:VQ domain-containing protein [Cephalotus follicularis]